MSWYDAGLGAGVWTGVPIADETYHPASNFLSQLCWAINERECALAMNRIAIQRSVSLTFSGGTVSATANGHGLSTGQSVVISGATQADYNGTFTVTVSDVNTFTYSIAGTPASPATGNPSMNGLTQSGGTATARTASAHGLATGDRIYIGGADQPEYGGYFTVTVTDTTTFTFSVNSGATSPATGYVFAFIAMTKWKYKEDGTSKYFPWSQYPISSLTQSGTTATATVTSHPFKTGDTLSISGTNQSDYNGTFSIVVTGANTFEYTMSHAPGIDATGNPIVTSDFAGLPIAKSVDRPTISVASLTRVGTTVYAQVPGHGLAGSVNGPSYFTIAGATPSQFNGHFATSSASWDDTGYLTITSLTRSGTTATAQTSVNHGYATGDYVMIQCTGGEEYQGAKNITVTGLNTFTFAVASSAVTPATGTIRVWDLTRFTYPISLAEKYLTSRPVTSLTAVLAAITCVCPSHGFANGDSVTISGANQIDYNGTFTITKIDNDTFTYTALAIPVSNTATGTITAIAYLATTATGTITLKQNAHSIIGIKVVSNVITYTCIAHGFSVNDWVEIIGGGPNDYASFYGKITAVTTDTFSMALTHSDATNINTFQFWVCKPVGIKRVIQQMRDAIEGILANTAIYFVENDGEYATAYTLSSLLGAGNYGSSWIDITALRKSDVFYPAKPITLSAFGATVTAVCPIGHQYATGDSVTISGANESNYNGTFVVTVVDATTFTYTSIPLISPATGTITATKQWAQDYKSFYYVLKQIRDAVELLTYLSAPLTGNVIARNVHTKFNDLVSLQDAWSAAIGGSNTTPFTPQLNERYAEYIGYWNVRSQYSIVISYGIPAFIGAFVQTSLYFYAVSGNYSGLAPNALNADAYDITDNDGVTYSNNSIDSISLIRGVNSTGLFSYPTKLLTFTIPEPTTAPFPTIGSLQYAGRATYLPGDWITPNHVHGSLTKKLSVGSGLLYG